MKICMIIPHFLPHVGGGENLFYEIAKGIQERGHEVRVVSSNSGGITGHVPYNGVDTFYYGWSLFSGHPIVKSKDLVEHVKWADIVHTTLFTTAGPARRMARKYKKPCILTLYEVLGDKWFWVVDSKIKAMMFDIYERLVCSRKFQMYHVISDSTGRDFEKYCGKRNEIKRVYCSVHVPQPEQLDSQKADVRKYFDLKQGEQCFLYFGRPAPNKGVFVLEKAIEILHERREIPQYVKFCWILAKDPAPQREMLLNRIKESGISEYIRIKPSVGREELFKMISGVDYVIIPSITEGFGFCAAEACSLGKPVIYSDGGSLPEVVFGKCLEFENRNAQDLSDKLKLVIEKGEAAMQTIPNKTFSSKDMIDGILEIYCKIGDTEIKVNNLLQ